MSKNFFALTDKAQHVIVARELSGAKYNECHHP